MNPRPLSRMILAALGLAGLVACYPPPPPPEPEVEVEPIGVLDSVRPRTEVRLLTEGRKLSGSLISVTGDSLRLRLTRTDDDTTLARGDLDSIWVRKGGGYTGTKAGLTFGLLAAAALVLAPQGSEGYGTLLAFRIGLIALGVGIIADVASPAGWTPVATQNPGP